MRSFSHTFSCLLLFFALSGCIAYVGPDSSQSDLNKETASKIIPQKSTKADVLRILGQPEEILADGKQFVYIKRYEVATILPRRAETGKKPDPAVRYLLKIDFDEQDVVTRRHFTAPYEFQDKPTRGVPPFTSPPLYR